MAADFARLGLVVDSKGVKQASTDLDKLGASAGKAEAATDRLKNTAGAASTQVSATGGAMRSMSDAGQNAANVTQLNAQQLANMQFQLQDIAVGLTSGQSPFTVIAQQGSQIAQAFGPGTGILGALRAVGTGITAFVTNPLNLAVIGTAAAAGAVSFLWSAVSGGTEADEALSRHEDLVQKITSAYGDAVAGVENYVSESSVVLETRARASLAALTEDYEAVAKDLARILKAGTLNPGGVRNAFAEFGVAITTLVEQARDGTPDVKAFQNAVLEIARTEPANRELQEIATEFLEASDAAGDAQGTMQASERALASLGLAASGAAYQMAGFTDAMADLGDVALPDLSDAEQALTLRDQALAGASTASQIAAVEAEYYAALDRIDDREAELAAKRDQRASTQAGRQAARAAEREEQRVLDVVEALEFEYAQMGRNIVEQRIHNELRRAGAAATDIQTGKIEELATGIENLQEKQERATEAQEFFTDAAYQGFASLIPQIETGNRALDGLIERLFEAALQAASLGSGPLADLFGSAGSGLITSLFGSLGGGITPTADALPSLAEAAPTAESAQAPTVIVNVTGAKGNQEVHEMVATGVSSALKAYERERLPGQVVALTTEGLRQRTIR